MSSALGEVKRGGGGPEEQKKPPNKKGKTSQLLSVFWIFSTTKKAFSTHLM